MEELLKKLQKQAKEYEEMMQTALVEVDNAKLKATPEEMIHIMHMETLAKKGLHNEVSEYLQNLSKK